MRSTFSRCSSDISCGWQTPGSIASVARSIVNCPAESSAEAESGEAWAAVRELPDKQRTAVTLRYMADLTNAEIAQVMGTSTDAARRSVYEALEKLRAQIGDDLTTLGAAASQ
ncbi:MAG TPA: sigma-70 family RNA polymerase sigma factor [Baekduia sp.]|nr:sigma-70 family RNA polymerase sigma factor [Baekduia sp.]